MTLTLKDIATASGVSESTVSRVLNDQPGIAPSTRTRVLDVAREMNFIPNQQARNLSNQKTGVVAMLTYAWPGTTHFVASSLDTDGVTAACQARGYQLATSTITDDEMKDLSSHPLLKPGAVDGVLLAGPALTPAFIVSLRTAGIPMVLIDNTLENATVDSILHDNTAGVSWIVDHLVDVHGRKSLAFMSGPDAWLSSRERGKALHAAADRRGVHARTFCMDDTTVEAGLKHVTKIVEGDFPADAIVAVNDATAIGAIEGLKDLNVGIGTDVSVTGFDNVTWGAFHRPSLTTLHAFGAEMGRRAAERLFEILESDTSDGAHLTLRVGTKPVIRESCGCTDFSREAT